MPPKKITVFLNPGSGAANGREKPERVVEVFRGLGVEAAVRSVAGERISEAAAEAVREGSSAVVAGGGDGTVNAVASALLGGDTPLGVLPLGTLNHFAKDLGIPLDLEKAARTITEGELRRVDVGEVNGRYFVNNSSIGLYPRVVRGREQEQRLGRGKLMALAWAVLAVLRRHPTASVRLTGDDGRTIRQRTPLVFIGNNPYEMRGLQIGSRASIETGKLAVYVLHHDGSRSLLRMGVEAIIGRLRQGADFDFLLADGVRLDARRDQLDVATDGEVTRLSPPLIYRIHPGALPVLAPPRTSPDR
ncbi:MAG TPA: diacylglycerol kinase family protein [Thermoanaerobaculia bacterium]|nr:diacylglycerol kinase family protein [Thermoanaerobaculia bacterium]